MKCRRNDKGSFSISKYCERTKEIDFIMRGYQPRPFNCFYSSPISSFTFIDLSQQIYISILLCYTPQKGDNKN